MSKLENTVNSGDASGLNLASTLDNSKCTGSHSFGERLLCEIGWSKPAAKTAEPNNSGKLDGAAKPGAAGKSGDKADAAQQKASPKPEISKEEAEFQKALENVRDPGAKYARLDGKELAHVLRDADSRTAAEIVSAIAGPEKYISRERFDSERLEFTQKDRLRQSLAKLSESDVVALINKLDNVDLSYRHRSPDARFDVIDYWRDNYYLPNSQPATAQDYKAWLKGHLASGGKISHDYDYNMPRMRVLKRDMEIPSLGGSSSIAAIVPAGINARFHEGRNGHSDLYYMDRFRANGSFVPLYKDIR